MTRGLIIDPLKKLVRFYQTMTETEIKQMQDQCRDSTARKRLIEKTKTEDGSNGTDARIRGNEYYSTKNGVIYTIYLKRLRAGRKNAVFL